MKIKWRSKTKEIVAESGETRLIMTDWDFPGWARTFGWDIRSVETIGQRNQCNHNGTDGTIDCPCGLTASDFIAAAREWLEEHNGAEVEDPGYFARQ